MKAVAIFVVISVLLVVINCKNPSKKDATQKEAKNIKSDVPESFEEFLTDDVPVLADDNANATSKSNSTSIPTSKTSINKGKFECCSELCREPCCKQSCHSHCHQGCGTHCYQEFNCDHKYPKNCADLRKRGVTESGVYKVNPDGLEEFEVYCDMVTDGGGWLIFQRRLDGTVDFFRGWNSYKIGFGNVHAEYWLGLEKIKRLTSQMIYELRVDLMDITGIWAYAGYDLFAVSSEALYYKLSLGSYYGTAGDSLTPHSGQKFSTTDSDHDTYSGNCATKFKGAWWYHWCYNSNLNGQYLGPGSATSKGIIWSAWKGSLYSYMRAEMKIRPVNF